jgi:hypothetical protein
MVLIMSNFRINGFGDFSSNDIGHVSSRDQNSFDSALRGSSNGSRQQQLAQESRATSLKASEEMTQASMDSIKSSVVQKKNEMIMKARGSAFKKAAELTKEISF